MKRAIFFALILMLYLPASADEMDLVRYRRVVRYLTETSRFSPTEESLYRASRAVLPRMGSEKPARIASTLLQARDNGELQAAMIRSMLESLDDPWARLYDPEQSRALRAELEGDSEVGLGLSVVRCPSPLSYSVIGVAPGSPAEGHFKPGDKVLALNGLTPQDPEFLKQLDGPKGDTIEFSVESDEGLRRIETLVFREYESQTAYLADHERGVIRIASFGEETPKQLRQALREIGDRPAIIDLRFNRGGYVSAAVAACDLFLEPEATIVTVVSRSGRKIHKAKHKPAFQAPVCLLVNRKTASAAEIFTAALDQFANAEVIGEKTFGKGSVQRLVGLPGDWALKYTTALYQTSSGEFIDKLGLMPDRYVTMRASLTFGKRDAQMAKALEWSKRAESQVLSARP